MFCLWVIVPCSAGPLWYRLRSSFCGPKVHSAVSSRQRTEPDLHLIKQVEQVVRLASEVPARIRSLRSTEPVEFRHFASKAMPRSPSWPLAAERQQTEHSRPDEGGQRRTDEHAQPHRRFTVGFAEGERADEQAHREADPGQNAGTVEGRPTGALRQLRPAAADHQRRRAEDTDLLAEKQARGDAERDWLENGRQ